MSDAENKSSNADYSWDQFDSEAYFQHYYGEPHPDDDLVIQLAVKAFKKAAADGDSAYDLVDVGTGPNLIPFFAALPVAKHLTAWNMPRAMSIGSTRNSPPTYCARNGSISGRLRARPMPRNSRRRKTHCRRCGRKPR